MVESARARASSEYVHDLRAENDQHMNHYMGTLRANKDFRTDERLSVGDSIIRSFSTHDENHCSFKQDISITVKETAQGWVGESEFVANHHLF